MDNLLRTKLYKFQRRAVRFLLRNGSAALFMEQGTGKTITALAYVARLWSRGYAKSVLVICPKAVIIGWKKQAEQHLNIPMMCWVGKKQIDNAEASMSMPFDGVQMLVVNYELFWRRPWIMSHEWDVIICDESHRIKAPKSNQSIMVSKLVAPYKLLLTGTPIEKDERDLFAQFHFIDNTIFGSWFQFAQEYMRKIHFGNSDVFKLELKPGSVRRLRERLAPMCFRVRAKDVLELPDAIDQAVYFELTGKCKRYYDEIERSFHTEVRGKKVSSHLAISNVTKLQQLTGGFLATDDEELISLEQDKLSALIDVVSDIPKHEKIVVFARFTEEIKLIQQAMAGFLGRTCWTLEGSTKDQGEVWTTFQSSTDPNSLVIQTRAGGVGIELFASCYAILYSNPLSYIDYDQLRKRLVREGQKRPVKFIHLIAENTIDEDVIYSLKRKHSNAETILRNLKRRRKNGPKKDQ